MIREVLAEAHQPVLYERLLELVENEKGFNVNSGNNLAVALFIGKSTADYLPRKI